MTDRFISMKYRTRCYNCSAEADQEITARPYRADVVCANCGATRIFVPRIEDVAAPGSFRKIGCTEIWDLVQEAHCRHCGLENPHTLTVGCNLFTVRCTNCGFTHFYRFDLEYIEKPPGVGAG